jgi:hypothetical protein
MPKNAERHAKAKSAYEMGTTFQLDGKFLKDEAREAVRSYFSPFVGIYAAATGRKIVLVRDKDGQFREQHRKGKAAQPPVQRLRRSPIQRGGSK